MEVCNFWICGAICSLKVLRIRNSSMFGRVHFKGAKSAVAYTGYRCNYKLALPGLFEHYMSNVKLLLACKWFKYQAVDCGKVALIRTGVNANLDQERRIAMDCM